MEVRNRIRELRRVVGAKWAAVFDDFDCLISDSQTLRVRINTYGSAPKKYGPRVVKIVSFSKSGNHRATVKKVKVFGNERVTAGGQIKRVRQRTSSIKKKAV